VTRSVHAQWIDVTAADGRRLDAYLALPPAREGPGLVLFQEIFGVNAHIQGVAEQYAQAGFVILAPDLFWRQERRVELGYDGDDRARALAMMKALLPAELDADIQSSVSALRGRGETAGRKLGALGFCLGGRLAYLAATLADVDAAVAYYGGGIQDRLDRAPAVRCPIQFHYAGKDTGIPLAAVERVQTAMAGKGADFHIYDSAGHGFNCWDRASHDPACAALAHGRSLVFLSQRLF